MKKLLSITLPVLVFALIAYAPKTSELPIGADLPKQDLKMKATTGKSYSFSDVMKDNGILVMFSCNTCPYVIRNQSRTLDIARYAGDKKIGVILLNSNAGQRGNADSYEAMQSYANDQRYSFPYVVDEQSVMADIFGANRTPEVFLFNKNKKLVYRGAIDDNPSNASAVNREHLRIAIDEMLQGKDISVKTSRSVGCSIKRPQ